MGNRAVITTKEEWNNDGIGVYLHWNGGRDSVEAFLKYCQMKGYRSPDKDCYGFARLCQVIGNFFGGTLSVGVGRLSTLDCDGDNGVYLIEDWKIIGRENFGGMEQNNYDINEMLEGIDECQPAKEQFGKEFWKAKDVKTSKLKIGDEIFFQSFDGEISKHKVVGIGVDEYCNGTNVKDIPYIDRYCSKNPQNNINNYLLGESYRKVIGKKSKNKVDKALKV